MLIIFWILPGVPRSYMLEEHHDMNTSTPSCPFLLPPLPPFSCLQEVCHPCIVTPDLPKGTTLPHSPSIKAGAAQSYASPARNGSRCGACRGLPKTQGDVWHTVKFLPGGCPREAHLPLSPGTWSVNGSRTWFREEVSQEAGAGEKLSPL